MTKKNKIIVYSIAAVVALIIVGAYFFIQMNPEATGNFLVNLEQNKEVKNENKAKREEFKKAEEKAKQSKLNTGKSPIIVPADVRESENYKKAKDYISEINKIGAGINFYENVSSSSPDDMIEGMGYLMAGVFPSLVALKGDGAYYAIMDAMYSNLRWETKYWLCQALGDMGEKRALPLFRDIAKDNNEIFLLRVSVLDQIGNFKDKDSNELVLSLLDNESAEVRNKASAIARDTTEPGDENTYEKVLSHYYAEEDLTVKTCLLGTAIVVGGEKALPDIERIIETAGQDEKETVAIMLSDIHTMESFDLLKRLYDPLDDNSSLIIRALAELEMQEANEFLYNIIIDDEKRNGLLSVMSAEYLKDHNQKGAIPYIKEALSKEKDNKGKFINDYEKILIQLEQLP